MIPHDAREAGTHRAAPARRSARRAMGPIVAAGVTLPAGLFVALGRLLGGRLGR